MARGSSNGGTWNEGGDEAPVDAPAITIAAGTELIAAEAEEELAASGLGADVPEATDANEPMLLVIDDGVENRNEGAESRGGAGTASPLGTGRERPVLEPREEAARPHALRLRPVPPLAILSRASAAIWTRRISKERPPLVTSRTKDRPAWEGRQP